MTPEHQAIADRLHDEARRWQWRRMLIGHRIRELEGIEAITEQALVGVGAIRQRQFLNEFASSSSQFVELGAWDKCVDLSLGPPDPTPPVLAGDGAIRAAVLQLRDLIDNATHLWAEREFDYAEAACEHAELALIDLRRIARAIGVIP